MTAFAALTLKNNALADVAFNPTGIDTKGVATWLDANGVYDAKSKVTMSVTLPSATSQVIRVKQRVAIPIMDPVNTTLKVAEAYVSIEFVLPKKASLTQRLDLRKHAETLISNAVTTAAATSLEGIY